MAFTWDNSSRAGLSTFKPVLASGSKVLCLGECDGRFLGNQHFETVERLTLNRLT
jgi:hypothetical protein